MLTRLIKYRAVTRNISTLVSTEQIAARQLGCLTKFHELHRRPAQLQLRRLSVYSRALCNRKKEDEEAAEDAEYIVNKDPQLPATVAVPEVWPHVPLLATRRNPVFPRFMKILEVSISLALAAQNLLISMTFNILLLLLGT